MRSKKKLAQKSQPQIDSHSAAQEAFVPVMYELRRTYHSFAMYSEKHLRSLGLTPSQFDVIATLGNTSGRSMGALAEKTLLTKGTLTGIIDRLERKGLVRREFFEDNRRSLIIVLTPQGRQTFEEVFPTHIIYLKERFEQLNKQELEETNLVLKKLWQLFSYKIKPNYLHKNKNVL